MHIEKVLEVTDEVCDVVQQLIWQLGVDVPKHSKDDLTLLINSGTSTLLVARHPDEADHLALHERIGIVQRLECRELRTEHGREHAVGRVADDLFDLSRVHRRHFSSRSLQD